MRAGRRNPRSLSSGAHSRDPLAIALRSLFHHRPADPKSVERTHGQAGLLFALQARQGLLIRTHRSQAHWEPRIEASDPRQRQVHAALITFAEAQAKFTAQPFGQQVSRQGQIPLRHAQSCRAAKEDLLRDGAGGRADGESACRIPNKAANSRASPQYCSRSPFVSAGKTRSWVNKAVSTSVA